LLISRKIIFFEQNQTSLNRPFVKQEQPGSVTLEPKRNQSTLSWSILPLLQKKYDYFGNLNTILTYTLDVQSKVYEKILPKYDPPGKTSIKITFEIPMMVVITQKEFSIQAGLLTIGSLSIVVKIVQALASKLLRKKYINSQANTVKKIEFPEEIGKKKSCCTELKELFCLLDKDSRKKLGERINYAALYSTGKTVEK
jgi:hypothetical protein